MLSVSVFFLISRNKYNTHAYGEHKILRLRISNAFHPFQEVFLGRAIFTHTVVGHSESISGKQIEKFHQDFKY